MGKKKEQGYLLLATWQDKSGTYRKKCYHTTATCPEDLYETLYKEHKWSEVDDPWELGHINGQHTSVAVFRIAEFWSDRHWQKWRDGKRDERREQLEAEERDADIAEIRRLIDKHSLSNLELLAAMCDGVPESE